MIKKNAIVSFALIIVIILSFQLPVLADNTDMPEDNVITDEMYALNALGVISLSDNDAPMSRADFLLSTMIMRGYTQDSYVISEMPYDDILPDHKCAGAVKYAFELGIIDKAESFRPDDAADLEFATEILLNAMGYKTIVELRGGYPSGCTKLPAYRSLVNGIGSMHSKELTKQQAVQILYNALCTDIVTQTAYPGSKSEYSVENRSMMNEYMNIYKSTGKISANYLANLGEPISCEKDEVAIDSVIYKKGNTDINIMIGRYVEYFYHYDPDVSKTREIIYYNSENGKKYIKIMYDDIKSYKNHTYSYLNEKGKSCTAEISQTADLIYNGKIITANQFSNSLLVPKYGYVELIYGESKNVCETVSVTSAYDCFIDTVSFNENICAVKDKYNSTSNISFDIAHNENYSLVDVNGNDIPVNNLKPAMVLTVLKTLDGEFAKVIVSNDKIRGEVQSYYNDEMTVDGKTYRFSPQFQLLVNNSFSFVLSNNADVYFDIYGEVAAVEYVQEVSEYGYLTDISKTSGLSGKLRLKYFGQNGSFSEYTVENSIFVDGQRFKDSKANEIINWLCPEGEFVPQLIKISYDEEGNINKIDTSRLGNEEWDGSLNEIELHEVLEVGANGDVGRKYKPDTLFFDGGVFLKDDVKVFLVPDGRFGEDQDYSITNKAYFEGDQFYDIQAYSLKKDSVFADAVVCKYFPKYSNELKDQLSDGSAIRPFRVYTSLPTAFVQKISKVSTDDGDVVSKIYLSSFTTHNDLSYIVRWEDSLENIGPGSIVKYYVGVNNKITFLEKIFDCDTRELFEGKYLNQNPSSEYYSLRTHKLIGDRIIGTAYGNNPNQFFPTWRMAYLDVISSSEGILKAATCDLKTEIPTEKQINFFKESSFGYVFEYDAEKKELIPSGVENIIPYDANDTDYSKVAVISRAGTLINAVIIFK